MYPLTFSNKKKYVVLDTLYEPLNFLSFLFVSVFAQLFPYLHV